MIFHVWTLTFGWMKPLNSTVSPAPDYLVPYMAKFHLAAFGSPGCLGSCLGGINKLSQFAEWKLFTAQTVWKAAVSEGQIQISHTVETNVLALRQTVFAVSYLWQRPQRLYMLFTDGNRGPEHSDYGRAQWSRDKGGCSFLLSNEAT